MSATANDMITSRLQRKFRKGRDLEMHISFTRIEGLEFVELRDFIPSADEYGKGYLFPSRMLTEVLEVLVDMDRYNSTAGSRPGQGQGSFPGMDT
jgi:hypothetical protein